MFLSVSSVSDLMSEGSARILIMACRVFGVQFLAGKFLCSSAEKISQEPEKRETDGNCYYKTERSLGPIWAFLGLFKWAS